MLTLDTDFLIVRHCIMLTKATSPFSYGLFKVVKPEMCTIELQCAHVVRLSSHSFRGTTQASLNGVHTSGEYCNHLTKHQECLSSHYEFQLTMHTGVCICIRCAVLRWCEIHDGEATCMRLRQTIFAERLRCV